MIEIRQKNISMGIFFSQIWQVMQENDERKREQG
jgi:hypothetical protein